MAIPRKSRKITFIQASLVLAIVIVALLNILHYNQQHQNHLYTKHIEMLQSDNQRLQDKLHQLQKSQNSNGAASTMEITATIHESPYQQKARSIRRFYWPDASNSPLISKLHRLLHPPECNSTTTKYFIWRSLPRNEEDTLGDYRHGVTRGLGC